MNPESIDAQSDVDGLLLRLDEALSTVWIIGIVLLADSSHEIKAVLSESEVGGDGQKESIPHRHEC